MYCHAEIVPMYAYTRVTNRKQTLMSVARKSWRLGSTVKDRKLSIYNAAQFLTNCSSEVYSFDSIFHPTSLHIRAFHDYHL